MNVATGTLPLDLPVAATPAEAAVLVAWIARHRVAICCPVGTDPRPFAVFYNGTAGSYVGLRLGPIEVTA